MKFLADRKTFPAFLGLMAGAILWAGCGTTKAAPPLLTEQYATNTVTKTNVVVEVIGEITNSAGQVAPVTKTNVVVESTPTITTNYVVNQTAQNVLGAAQTANTLSSPVNPYSGVVGAGLGLLSAGLGIYAGVMTKSKNAHQSVARTLVQAIEQAPEQTGTVVKGLVADISKGNGTAQTIHDFVQNITG